MPVSVIDGRGRADRIGGAAGVELALQPAVRPDVEDRDEAAGRRAGGPGTDLVGGSAGQDLAGRGGLEPQADRLAGPGVQLQVLGQDERPGAVDVEGGGERVGERARLGLADALGVERLLPVDLVQGREAAAGVAQPPVVLRVLAQDGTDVFLAGPGHGGRVHGPGTAVVVGDLMHGAGLAAVGGRESRASCVQRDRQGICDLRCPTSPLGLTSLSARAGWNGRLPGRCVFLSLAGIADQADETIEIRCLGETGGFRVGLRRGLALVPAQQQG